MKYCVEALDRGVLHILVIKFGDFDTFHFLKKYWLRYLPRIINILALWEDLFALYQLANAEEKKTAWLRQEVERRVSASLRFAWISAVVLVSKAVSRALYRIVDTATNRCHGERRFPCTRGYLEKYWQRYWALRFRVVKFWLVYLALKKKYSQLRQEVKRRVFASLRFP